MEIGEKYLKIKIVGHDYIAAFPNKGKEAPNQPDYKGDGVAVWVQEKRLKTAEIASNDVVVESVNSE